MGRFAIFIVAMLVMASLIAMASVTMGKNAENYGKIVIINGVRYTTHSPIRINNDTDFASQASVEGWQGDGSVTNPYIIEGYDIDAHGAGNAIYIGNTTVHFIIRNCRLHNASYHSWPYFDGDGITLYKVKNGTIENNTIYHNGDDGIYLFWYSGSNTITNNTIYNNWDGIHLDESSSNTITNNTIYNNRYGISLVSSSNRLYGNNLTNNGIVLGGWKDTFTTQDIPTNNTVNGKPVYYYKNVNMNNASVPLDAGQVILGNVSWLKVENLKINNASTAIEIGFSSHITITNNTIYNNKHGISLVFSSNNHIYNNTVSNKGYHGIYLYSSSNNYIYNNTVSSNNLDGILLDSSSNNNVLSNNTIYNNNSDGIYLYQSSSNYITRNRIENNTNYGIYIDSGSNNHIYGNIFAYNHGSNSTFNSLHIQAKDNGNNNWWNSSSGYGNYWLDWAENNDTNDQNPQDGIVDWPYKIDSSAGAKDYYPLKNRITITVPLPPKNLRANAGDGYVNLTWSAPLDNGGSEIKEYKIYRDGVLIKIVSASQLWYNDTSVTSGQTYTYYVTAVNSVGESDKSNEVQATPGGAIPEFSAMEMLVVSLLMSIFAIRRKR